MLQLTKDTQQLQTYLRERDWLAADETIQQIEVPGEGNMNFTLRIITPERTFIIKQSRDYVEKYPHVAAPAERVLREAEFYQRISSDEVLHQMTPEVLGLDEENSIMLLTDLGAGSDYTSIYQEGQQIAAEDLRTLMDFAAQLHDRFPVTATDAPIRNPAMRKLNHEHIFVYPYLENNGLNLDDILPGMQTVASPYRQLASLKSKMEEMGKIYLADGSHLLHGDYFPGSWLRTAAGIRVIDPEFCFYGPPAFEVGVTLAHLKMADQSEELVDLAYHQYTQQRPLDEVRCREFMAVEIMRRLLGLAQLPLHIGLKKRKDLLNEAANILL